MLSDLKGQEGHVVGWKSGVGSRGQLVLETLYVKPIRQSQVQILPKFAMTVYASQGKTRPDNVVILGIATGKENPQISPRVGVGVGVRV